MRHHWVLLGARRLAVFSRISRVENDQLTPHPLRHIRVMSHRLATRVITYSFRNFTPSLAHAAVYARTHATERRPQPAASLGPAGRPTSGDTRSPQASQHTRTQLVAPQSDLTIQHSAIHCQR
eukprot:5392575-Pleurochrysis_carterae.AAC.1